MMHRALSRDLLLAVASLATLVAQAQGPQPRAVPVRVTAVVRSEVRRAVTLPGTVESRTAGEIAAEVEGRVIAVEAREGTGVKAGDTVVRLSRTNLELRQRALEGQIREARARLDLAKRNLERAEELYGDGVVSRGEYDDAVSEASAWLGRLDQLQAELEQVEVDLRRCDIDAPYAGVVVAESTEIGQWVSVGDPVAELLASDRLEVRVEVPERYFADVVLGTTATVTFESLPALRAEGRVSAVIPRANDRARTFPVKIRFDVDGHRVAAGMLAQVSLPLGERYEGLLVPKDAIVRQGPERIVYRLDDNDTAEAVEVRPGMGVGDWIIVDGPLAAGERVITRGNERLRPGQQVVAELQEYPLP